MKQGEINSRLFDTVDRYLTANNETIKQLSENYKEILH